MMRLQLHRYHALGQANQPTRGDAWKGLAAAAAFGLIVWAFVKGTEGPSKAERWKPRPGPVSRSIPI